MATKRSSGSKRSGSRKRTSSGSGPKSKRTVRKKMQKTMHEYKHGQLKSGGRKNVKSRKQAIAIGLSEARRAGANVPPNPKKRGAKKKSSSRSSSAKKSSSRKK